MGCLSYIADPTSVFLQFLDQEHGMKPRREFLLGRMALALELLTVIKTLEDEVVPMLTLQRMEIISILETFLREQNLVEQANEWYDALDRWRKPTFVSPDNPMGYHFPAIDSSLVDNEFSVLGAYDPASLDEKLEGILARPDSNPVPLDVRRSQDLPSSASGEQPDEEGRSKLIESDESPGDNVRRRIEFRQGSHDRHRKGS